MRVNPKRYFVRIIEAYILNYKFMIMSNSKEKVSLKKKLQERVKRSLEPFKGTLGIRRSIIASSTENTNEHTPEQEREQIDKQPTLLEKKLRERIEGSSQPFQGSLGNISRL